MNVEPSIVIEPKCRRDERSDRFINSLTAIIMEERKRSLGLTESEETELQKLYIDLL